MLNKERTSVYKILRQLARNGLIQQTKRSGVTHFWAKDLSPLFSALQKEKEHIKLLEEKEQHIAQELAQKKKNNYPHFPQIAFYDGKDGISALYNDIYTTPACIHAYKHTHTHTQDS